MAGTEPSGVARAWPVYEAKEPWERPGNAPQGPITGIRERCRSRVDRFPKRPGCSIHAVAQEV